MRQSSIFRFFFVTIIYCWCSVSVFAQPGIEWQNTIGGNNQDYLKSVKQCFDGGFILGGHSRSNISGDKNENNLGFSDYWVVKLKPNGAIEWQNTIGGTGSDEWAKVHPTSDGGYIMGGSSASNISGDKTEDSNGSYDYWVVKLNSSGNIQWQNTIGGEGFDYLFDLQPTMDNGYILGGRSDSDISGDKTEDSLGDRDYWIVKLDVNGNIQWQNTIGGWGDDLFIDLQQTLDGGYIIGGMTDSSISGDKTEANIGGKDYWILKLDISGNIEWQNTIGGSADDSFRSIHQTKDGGFILGGYSYSNISGDKTENSNGESDYWVIKVNQIGEIEWQNTIGGDDKDNLTSLQQTNDGGFILGGYSDSNISGDKIENSIGSNDYWVVKLNSSGEIEWQNTIGGNGSEELIDLQQTKNGGYILGGASESGISGDKTEGSNGLYDYWLIKLKPVSTIVEGRVWVTSQNNCDYDVNDPLLNRVILKMYPEDRYTLTDTSGQYRFYADTGTYNIQPIVAQPYTSLICPDTGYHQITLTEPLETSLNNDFVLNIDAYCPLLQISIGGTIARPCLTNKYIVNYCNSGTTAAEEAFVIVTFPEVITPYSSPIPWENIENNVYRFEIGDIPINTCDYFYILANISCEAKMGETACVEAHIFPDSLCNPIDPNYDGSLIRIKGWCLNDSLACFQIINATTNNMINPSQYRVYANDTLLFSVPFQLMAYEELEVCIPTNGKTIRLEADPSPGNPDQSISKAIVEACGEPKQLGFVITVPQEDDSNFIDFDCQVIRNSFDPNDKLVIPAGITEQNYVKPEDHLEYTIRFQNTGNDTAFRVRIVDTLDLTTLDIASLQTGASSHPYTFDIYGPGIIEWTFENILLPDSTTNEPESHGFVKFHIDQIANNPNGTFIQNRAGIYFDFNLPIMTPYSEVLVFKEDIEHCSDSDQYYIYSSICPGEHYQLPGGNFVSDIGIYYDTLISANNCSKTVITELTSVFETSIIVSEGTLYTNQEAATYQWIDCGNGAPILNATEPFFSPVESGNYAVIFTADECIDTSECQTVVVSDVSSLSPMEQAHLYPNPVSKLLYFDLIQAMDNLTITNISGKKVRIQDKLPMGTHTIDIGELPDGIYTAILSKEDRVVWRERFVISH